MIHRLIVILALAMPLVAVADMFSASPSCSKPHKPYKFTSEWELESYRNDVREYKECIEEFVEEQENAARRHRAAANEAVEEWNSFVRYGS